MYYSSFSLFYSLYNFSPAEGAVCLYECPCTPVKLNEHKYEQSYFESFLELLSNSACLRRIPFTAGSQVSQLGHELLHLLTLTQHLLPVGPRQSIGQPAALRHQPADGCLA